MRLKFLLSLFILLYLVSCSNEPKSEPYLVKTTKSSNIDTSNFKGKIVTDSTEFSELVDQFIHGPSLSRNELQSVIVADLLGAYDLEGFVKKVSNDTVFCIGTGFQKLDRYKKHKTDLITQENILEVYPQNQSTYVFMMYETKIKNFDSLPFHIPKRIVIFGKN